MKLFSWLKCAVSTERFVTENYDAYNLSEASSPIRSKTSLGKIFAFTLAEVLIVLLVIGAIASLTIPTLLQNAEEKSLFTQFQETYSIIQQVYLQVAQDNGTADKWAVSGDQMYSTLKPYFKTIKDCPDGSCTVFAGKYKTLAGGDTSSGVYYYIILANGAALYFDASGGFAAIQFDTNGYKPPNKVGYDLFEVELTKKNDAPFVSWPFYTSDGSSFVETSSDSCNKSSPNVGFWNGGGCSYWIIKNGNMDYLHRNIPNAEWSK